MIDPNTKLTILHDDDSTISDHSQDLADFTRDQVTLTLTTADYLYLGFYKPFGTVFAELATPSTIAGDLSAEYFDGTVWQSLSLNDETKGLNRSGFMSWDKEALTATTIDGKEAHYIRLAISVDGSEMVLQGLNLVFSDDTDLKNEFAEAADPCLYASGFNSHIITHVASRNHIVQTLRNEGYIKWLDGSPKNVTQWDLMNVTEIRQASMHLTLSKIFFRMSDSTESIWWAKHREYADKFEQSFRIVRLTLDKDDDGLTDETEKHEKTQSVRWRR